MRHFAICLFAVALLIAAAPPAHAIDDADYARLNAALVEHHIVPRQRALAAATEALNGAAPNFCAQPGTERLAALRAAHVAAGDAWQDVQHVRFGPIELFMRQMRFAFWPDPRNTAGRHLDEILAKRDAAAIAPEALARGSVAVQGLPALERLLYGDEAQKKLLAHGPDATFRCEVLRAVAANLAGMARDVAREWTEGDNAFARVMADAQPSALRYREPREATLDLFKSLHAAVELVADHKLARPLGPSRQAARPRLAESWRSGRSLANIQHNLAAGAALYAGEGGFGFSALVRARDPALDDLLTRAFVQTLASARAIAGPLEDAVADPKQRPAVERLAREAAALKTLLAQRLTVAIDIPLGFNALDGD